MTDTYPVSDAKTIEEAQRIEERINEQECKGVQDKDEKK